MTEQRYSGFNEFSSDPANYSGEDGGRMRALVSAGQKPHSIIISCSDSRSSPEIIFKSDAGEIFGHKAIGAIVRPYSRLTAFELSIHDFFKDKGIDTSAFVREGTALSAALEVGINALDIQEITLLGHTNCAAVQKLVNHTKNPHLKGFLRHAHKAVARAQLLVGSPEEIYRKTEEQTLVLSAENLRQYPMVQEALQENPDFKIHVELFDMYKGVLLSYDETAEEFVPVAGNTKLYEEIIGHHGHDHHDHNHAAPSRA